jgi:hypothetical protein
MLDGILTEIIPEELNPSNTGKPGVKYTLLRLKQEAKESTPQNSNVEGIVIVSILVHPKKELLPRITKPFCKITDVNPRLLAKQES